MPWPKGTPLPPEVRAKIAAGARRAHAAKTADERSDAANRRWARRSQESRAISLHNLHNTREGAARANAASVASSTRCLAHLTAEQMAQYRDLRRKQLSRAEALALVETGRLP